MKYLNVKAYADLVEKSDKTIYKQIKKGTIEAVRVKKGYQVCVDTNMLKRLQKMERALEEAKSVLKAMEEESDAKSKKTDPAPPAPKKAGQTVVKKTVKKPLKKTVVKKGR